ncbi:hypothetical protein [Bacillus toyonensis]|uniref:hypothetical protein n=1 Tax=Bacillus toyonensis TaxID=155322 RepID=UPI000BFE0DED|nr:hypothetical protein [Bacillus toyonensis]PHC13441.1 hypothetical protein COF03_26235 [Bacillus toyonensis]
MNNVCRNIPDNAQIQFERCRVVNVCVYVCLGLENIDKIKQSICEQIEDANKIWCSCNIVFNIIKIEHLSKFVDNPSDYSFTINSIDSPDDFFNNMAKYPNAKNLYDLKPCCSDKPHINIYITGGDRFNNINNKELIAAKGDTQTHKYFIMMPVPLILPSSTYLANALGKCFGLNDNLNDPSNVMFPDPPGTGTKTQDCELISSSELVQEEFFPVSYTTPFPRNFNLTIESMEVSEVDDGLDLDDDLEVSWDFLLNKINPSGGGSSQHFYWNYDGIDEDRTYLINLMLTFQIDKENEEASLRVGGQELDDDGNHDALPHDLHSFTKSNSWGVGKHTFELSNPEITCKIHYRIELLPTEKHRLLDCQGAII